MADSSIDTRPTEVDIDHYGGNTLSLRFTIDSAVVAGRTYTGQVRSQRTAQKVEATFSFVTDATGANAVLASVDTQRLSQRGKFVGYWDVQLAEADGGDPVVTLAHGELRIHPDVTRQVT